MSQREKGDGGSYRMMRDLRVVGVYGGAEVGGGGINSGNGVLVVS